MSQQSYHPLFARPIDWFRTGCGAGACADPTPPSVYPFGDSRRIFCQGTPKEVWYLMVETWTVVGAPSNARIAEDISGWERVCDKIIEAKGTIVPDENFRTGRRARKMHGEGNVLVRQSCASATARHALA